MTARTDAREKQLARLRKKYPLVAAQMDAEARAPKLRVSEADREKPEAAVIDPTAEGGLFHDPDAFAGTYVLNFYDAMGRRIAIWEAIDGATDDTLMDAFLDFLSRQGARRPRLLKE